MTIIKGNQITYQDEIYYYLYRLAFGNANLFYCFHIAKDEKVEIRHF